MMTEREQAHLSDAKFCAGFGAGTTVAVLALLVIFYDVRAAIFSFIGMIAFMALCVGVDRVNEIHKERG